MCRALDALFGASVDSVASSSKAAAAVAWATIDEQRVAYDKLVVDGWDIFQSLVSCEKKCRMLQTRMQDVMGMMSSLFDGLCTCNSDGCIVTHSPTLEGYIDSELLTEGSSMMDLAANADEQQRLKDFLANLSTNLKIEVTLQTGRGDAVDATLSAAMLSPGVGTAEGGFILGFQFSFPLQHIHEEISDIFDQVEECSQYGDLGVPGHDQNSEHVASPPQTKIRQDASWIRRCEPELAQIVEDPSPRHGEHALVPRSTVVKNTFIHCSSSEADDEERHGRATSAPPKMREMLAKRRVALKLQTAVAKMVKVMNVVKIWTHCQRTGGSVKCVLEVNQPEISMSVNLPPSQGVVVPDDGIIRISSWPQVGHSPLIPNLSVKNTFIHLAGEGQVVETSRPRARSVSPSRSYSIENVPDPFCFNTPELDDDDDDIVSQDGEAASVKSVHSYCGSTTSAWQSSAASVASGEDTQVIIGNRVRDRNLMTEGLCDDRLPVAQLSTMLEASQQGLRSIGGAKHCSGECYPCLMEAWYQNGKSPQPCKFGSLCGRCHEKHSHADVRKLKRHMAKR